MNTIELARLEEARQAIATCDCAIESEAVGGGWMSFAGDGSWANQACGLGLSGPVTGTDLDRLVEFYASRGVEPRIEVCALADATLVDGLANRGFVIRDFENVLARRIDSNERFDFGPLPEGATCIRSDPDDAAQVDVHARVGLSGFIDGEPTEALIETARKATCHPRTRAFDLRIDDQIVAAGACEVSGDACALFGLSVVPAHRSRGIQLALMRRRLEEARDSGCKFAVIHTRPGAASERNAHRAGFRLEYVKAVLVHPRTGVPRSM